MFVLLKVISHKWDGIPIVQEIFSLVKKLCRCSISEYISMRVLLKTVAYVFYLARTSRVSLDFYSEKNILSTTTLIQGKLVLISIPVTLRCMMAAFGIARNNRLFWEQQVVAA